MDTPRKSEKAAKKTQLVKVNDKDLGVPSEGDLMDFHEDGHTCNHDFVDLTGAFTYKEAKAIAKEEDTILAWIDAGGDAEAWCRDQFKVCGDLLAGFDPGVMGAVAALVASGCSPLASCNGCPGHWSDQPVIYFWCPRKVWPKIRRAAEFTGVCLQGAGGAHGDGIRAYHPNDWRAIREFGKALVSGRRT